MYLLFAYQVMVLCLVSINIQNEEGTLFSGRVTVNINLARPVSVRTGCPLPDICVSTLKQYEHSIDTNKRRTTFFMPKATSQVR